MNQINSRNNPKLKLVRKLQSDKRTRHKERRFIVEGERWLAELANYPDRVSFFLTTDAWMAEKSTLLNTYFRETAVYVLPQNLFDDCSVLETPVGVLAVVEIVELSVEETPKQFLILDAVSDPGNLGTILRSASAVGVSGVIFAPDCVDPFNPKAVRASMGALLRIPLIFANWDEISQLAGQFNVYLADSHATESYTDLDWTQPSALIVSNEANGASETARSIANPIAIPMNEGTESLNAAVAASVILFEAKRQLDLAKI